VFSLRFLVYLMSSYSMLNLLVDDDDDVDDNELVVVVAVVVVITAPPGFVEEAAVVVEELAAVVPVIFGLWLAASAVIVVEDELLLLAVVPAFVVRVFRKGDMAAEKLASTIPVGSRCGEPLPLLLPRFELMLALTEAVRAEMVVAAWVRNTDGLSLSGVTVMAFLKAWPVA
jgi:hypothetical protein